MALPDTRLSHLGIKSGQAAGNLCGALARMRSDMSIVAGLPPARR
jgi:hypothetical protein